jgi:L-alanine-DL-glutamate epimerase-like enolase superfamily enzyme
MKITHINARIVRFPAVEPLADGPVPAGTLRDVIAVKVGTDDGIEGIGFSCFPGYYSGPLSGALKLTIEYFGSLLIGEDPLKPEAAVHKLHNATHYAGPGGIAMLAQSAIDIALWDIKGKTTGLSLATMTGGRRKTVPAYASGTLQRAYPLDHVVSAAKRLVDKGFREIKMQLGLGGTHDAEIERVKLVREAIGHGVKLMVDVNQRWGVHEAMALGRRLEEYRLSWLEDVTTYDDFAGQGRIAAALDTPLAGGEYVFGITPFRHMLEARAVDIVMIDLLRVGGITQWLKVASMAEAFNLPVISHIMPEISMQLVAGVANGMTVEYIPWAAKLYETVPAFANGELTVPDRPGLGLSFDEDFIKHHAVG